MAKRPIPKVMMVIAVKINIAVIQILEASEYIKSCERLCIKQTTAVIKRRKNINGQITRNIHTFIFT
jgi:hypothetical protein